MKRRRAVLLTAGMAAGLLILSAWWAWPRLALPNDWTLLARSPRIRPDYRAAVIPPNIAPLNFVVDEPGTAYYVRIDAPEGPSLAVPSADGGIRIPPRSWKAILSQNRGRSLSVEVFVRDQNHRWQRFQAFSWTVALEPIDPYLVYRLLDPIFNRYHHLGIYQRNLEADDQSPVLFNASIGMGCVNCHAFPSNRPDPFLLHARYGVGESVSPGLLVARGGKAGRVSTRTETTPKPAGFTAWHPSGTLAAFSINNTVQFVHGTGTEVREVFDRNSDLAIVDFRTGAVSSPPAISDPARLETFPAWSPDGKYLYFCSAPRAAWDIEESLPEDYRKVKYDLMRIRYTIASNTWGKPELLLAAAETGKSILQPRASPDGRYLLFCMCDHGPFPAFREDSDLYLMDLANRRYRRLAANSPRSESWHCWSSNSRWIVFSSRRDNGLVAWPYLCYVDRSGQDHQPFLLPQSDPRFYDTCLKTYNLPELITGPITVSEQELVRALQTEAPNAAAGAPEVPLTHR
jgi:hypothetical protein